MPTMAACLYESMYMWAVFFGMIYGPVEAADQPDLPSLAVLHGTVIVGGDLMCPACSLLPW